MMFRGINEFGVAIYGGGCYEDQDGVKYIVMRNEVGPGRLFYRVDRIDRPVGRRDKKGFDIYENDIIEWGDDKRHGRVVFREGRFFVSEFAVSYFDDPTDAFGEGLSLLEVVDVWK